MKIVYISTKVLYTIILISAFILICIIIFNTYFHKTNVTYLPITNRIIGIDPGHGGVDPGAVSKTGLEEDDINLKIALKLKRFVEQSGGIPVLTRDTDEGLYTDKFYSHNEADSQKLAYLIQEELRNVLDENNKRMPNEKDDVYLINEIEIPSVLVEAGFLSNEVEAKLLNTSEYQEKIAWAIYAGIMRYFNEQEIVNKN